MGTVRGLLISKNVYMNCKPTSVVPAFLALTPQHLLHESVDTYGNQTAVQGIKWIYIRHITT